MNRQSACPPGGAVLVHTGFAKYYMVDNATYVRSSPGLGEEAAHWLSEQNVCAIGADNMGVEVMPMEDERKAFPVHQHLLVEKGVYIIENLKLDEPCADDVYDFPFILLATKYKGATACPVRPIGLVSSNATSAWVGVSPERSASRHATRRTRRRDCHGPKVNCVSPPQT